MGKHILISSLSKYSITFYEPKHNDFPDHMVGELLVNIKGHTSQPAQGY